MTHVGNELFNGCFIIDGAASEATRRRHFSSVDVRRFSTVFIQKKTLSIPASCRFFIRKTDEISRTLRLIHDGISFDKILPKQVGYFENLTENNLRNNSVTTLAAPRRGLVSLLFIDRRCRC
jgi:hypothetical protein